MAFFAHSRPVADGVFGRSFGLSFGDAFARIVAWNDKRVTRNVLNKLTDRELDDIGLHRGDIESVVASLR
ncbi:DUF1127 domain-containing protein [Pararhodobacter oceanensis]|uniref:YjiS-like domain-containing protein n=1 Tax=Pararhodobacter oceanensis TaxID=2172121 RepID=A0A2T8HVD2_9RHOB|nr:DUF1127 domain-containing protein [Pararhodobacter oceanensis]PVH29409.1 hypothetical protein DDE20_04530 [Pararhodobacter oceanensis]